MVVRKRKCNFVCVTHSQDRPKRASAAPPPRSTRCPQCTMARNRPRSLRAFAFGSRRNTSPGPPSPTFSDSTNASAINFGADGPTKIITRSNLKASLQAYEDVRISIKVVVLLYLHSPFNSCTAHDNQCELPRSPHDYVKGHSRLRRCNGKLQWVSRALKLLAFCRRRSNRYVRLKGPSYEACTRLQAASGLHHLVGNHWHVLVSESCSWIEDDTLNAQL